MLPMAPRSKIPDEELPRLTRPALSVPIRFPWNTPLDTDVFIPIWLAEMVLSSTLAFSIDPITSPDCALPRAAVPAALVPIRLFATVYVDCPGKPDVSTTPDPPLPETTLFVIV